MALKFFKKAIRSFLKTGSEIKLLCRREEGIQSIGLMWDDQPWARKAIEVLWHRPTLKDPIHPKKRFVLQVQWGPGAGYKNGLTGFLAWKCKNRCGQNTYNGLPHKLIQFGITRNANIIPYVY